MFFMFHILAFTVYISNIYNLPVYSEFRKEKNTDNIDNNHVVDNKDNSQNKSSAFPTHKQMFHLIKSLTNTRSPNLKSNIFDRMLSDEMFSIKEHIYGKEITQTMPTTVWNKISAPTPTLEVKQQWPVINLLSNNIEYENSKLNNKLNTQTRFRETSGNDFNHNKELKTNNESKILELRSLPEHTSFYNNDDVYQSFHTKTHICQKPGTYTTCNHRCTESMKICTHTPNTSWPLYSQFPAFYMPYQSYIIGGVSESPNRNEYYHPYILNELKLPKPKKHRKTTAEYPDEYLYYDNNNEKEKYTVYGYSETGKTQKKPRKNKKNDVVINLDYDVETDDETKSSTRGSLTHENKLFKDVIDDLHTYIKKCYCSSSTRENGFISSLSLPLALICYTHFYNKYTVF